MIAGANVASTEPGKYFYKYMTASTAKKVLLTGALRWSSPLILNDPVDVKRAFDLGFDLDALEEAIHREVDRLVLGPEEIPLPANPKLESAIKVVRQAHSSGMETMLRELLPEFVRREIGRMQATQATVRARWEDWLLRLRILSVSEKLNNPAMWAYYADGQQGIVLEFVREGLNSASSARAVSYKDGGVTVASVEEWVRAMTGQIELNFEQRFEPFIYTKTFDWAHEREWRLKIVLDRAPDEDKFSAIAFDEASLSAIYLGVKLTDNDRDEIVRLACERFPKAAICTTGMNYRTSSFVFSRLQ